MAKDILGGLGGLGGLMKGLSGLMPQDDPQVKVLNARTNISELQDKERTLYEQIGRTALARYGSTAFNEEAQKLAALQQQFAEAEAELAFAQKEADAKERAEREIQDSLTCPSCGTINPEGTKFCQECGSKLGVVSKIICPNCKAEHEAGTRFCGECGAKLV